MKLHVDVYLHLNLEKVYLVVCGCLLVVSGPLLGGLWFPAGRLLVVC